MSKFQTTHISINATRYLLVIMMALTVSAEHAFSTTSHPITTCQDIVANSSKPGHIAFCKAFLKKHAGGSSTSSGPKAILPIRGPASLPMYESAGYSQDASASDQTISASDVRNREGEYDSGKECDFIKSQGGTCDE